MPANKNFLNDLKAVFFKVRFLYEHWLYHHGFNNADARTLVAINFMLTSVLLLVGLILLWITPWVLWVGVGAVLTACNFYFLAHRIQNIVPKGFSKRSIIFLVLNFYVRLLITGILLFVFLIIFKAPVTAILLGVSLTVGTSAAFVFTKLHMLKNKEA